MYWDLVDRPNLMIKIPATDEGLPAIEQALFDGMNINVTLLFSVAAYEKVMEAYIRGDGAPPGGRQAAGPPLGRVVLRLARGHRGRQAPRGRGQHRAAGHGRAGQRPRRLPGASSGSSSGERFAALREAGCPVQRPLWASTGVKNPAYPATLYVWGLVAPDTVNTMPMPDAAGRRHRGRAYRRDRRRGPDRRPEGAGRRRASTSTTSPISCCARASTPSWSRCRSCWTGSRPSGQRSPRKADRSPRAAPGRARPGAARRRGARGSGRRRRSRPAGQQDRALAQLARERQVVGDDQQRAVEPRRASPSARGACAGRGSRYGSSSTSRLGSIASTVAIATRRRWPSAELVRRAVGVLAHPHRLQRALHAVLDLGLGEAEVERPERDVLAHGRHEQLVVGVLEDEADAGAQVAHVVVADAQARDLELARAGAAAR